MLRGSNALPLKIPEESFEAVFANAYHARGCAVARRQRSGLYDTVKGKSIVEDFYKHPLRK